MESSNLINRYSGTIIVCWILLLGGCGLSPGMKMNVSYSDADGWNKVENSTGDQITIQLITAELVNDLSKKWLQDNVKKSLQNKTWFDEALKTYRYRVQAQDILQITVWDHPELTIPSGEFRTATSAGNLIRHDGTMYYPYIGVIKVAGKTVEEVRQALVRKLSTYIENPQLDVRVASYRSQKVYVTGNVKSPGVFPVTDVPLTVLDALGQAQGVLPETDLQHVTISRKNETFNVDVFALLNKGHVEQNHVLYAGDSVYVPNNNLNKIFVLGEVKTQSSLLIPNEGMTLAEAISGVGGYDLETSDPENVFVIRGVRVADRHVKSVDRVKLPASMEIYHLNSKSPDSILLADQFQLQARDIVYVSTKGIARWSRVLNKLGTTINAIAVTRALTR